jgi:hypothetical protein
MEPEKLAAASVLVANGGNLGSEHAEHGAAGVPVLAMRLTSANWPASGRRWIRSVTISLMQ